MGFIAESGAVGGSKGRGPLLDLPIEEREGRLRDLLVHACARALDIPAREVDPARPLTAFGLDSLAAIELSQEVNTALGFELSFEDLLDGPSIDQLVEQLLLEIVEVVEPGAAAEASPTLPEDGEPSPLSHSQRALWFLDRLEPGNPAYVIAASVRIVGDIASAALREAFEELYARHPALRTTFGERDGEPYQEVAPRPAAGWFFEGDLSGMPPGARGSHLAAEAFRPFDLQRGPLLRLGLFRTGPAEHHLVLSIHHLVADLWSLGVLVGELSTLLVGRSLPLPPTITYVEHVRRERLRLAGPDGERAWAFWRERLADAPGALELPTDRPRPPVQTFRGGLRSLRLRPGVDDRVTALAADAAATPFMVLLAAWASVLGRWSGQRDLLIGTPTAGRGDADSTGVVGYFVNPVVLRVDLSSSLTFRELLDRVRTTSLSAYAHQYFPVALVTERLVRTRDPSRSPLFQVMFGLQKAPLPEADGLAALALGVEGVPLKLGGLAAESAALDRPGAQFDLSLFLAQVDGGLAACLEFNADLWDGVSARRLLIQFESLLAAAVSDPSQRPEDLRLLTRAQEQQLLREWSRTSPGAARPACLHELFEAQAQRTPEAVALVCGQAALSYAELERRAGRLARRLRALGVGPEVRVGVAMSRTPALVEAMLAVLKAGGAYVPLDLAYPAERIAFTLRDSGASLVLVRGTERLPDEVLGGVTAVDVDSETVRPGAGLPASEPVPDNLAYVIYTSGSTGRPKGVAIRHASVTERLRWAASVFPSEDLSGLLASTSICFDLSVFELFLPLTRGGRSILVDDALALPSLASVPAVTLLNTVPSVLAELLHTGELPSSLRTLNLAGEPLSRRLVDETFRSAPWIRRVLNLYGPSEDTTYSTWGEARRGDAAEPGIGRPLASTRAHLVDHGLRIAPPGWPAELCLGGGGLARGYLGRPRQTAEAFVPDPFSGEPGARLYRTGDLARHRMDGTLLFLGRIDDQVKVRGFRIELGEVEAALASHPGVAECAVAALREGAERSLAAYWVARAGTAATPAELREHLRGRLPEPMVPTAWMELEHLPTTPSGKLDRRALPEPPAPEGGGAAGPRTAVEEIVAGVWARVLGLETVGAEASFFELGGHSLLATRVVARLRKALGVDLPLRSLFEAPTVRALAAAAERARAAGEGAAYPPLVAEVHGALVPTSPAQERMWFLERFDPGSVYTLPAAVRLLGGLDVAALAAAQAEIVRRHEVLRTTFVEGDDGVLQRVAPPPPARLPVVDLAGLPAGARETAGDRLAAEEARRPFDLEAGPLLRTVLLRSGPEEHTLLLSMHHVISDGWSLGVLSRELGALYGAFREDRPSPLPELALQYADYALWQRRWLDGEEPAAGLRYWSEALAGLATLELPTDRPRPPAGTFRGGVLRRGLPPVLAGRTLECARGEGATLFMVLLAAFAGLLARLAGQDDVPIGTPVANRDRVEVEELIGLFVNTLVLRTDASGDPSFSGLLGRVRERCLAGYGHQEVPFERLVEALQPERDPSRTPLFQVMLALQDAASEAIELPGLATEAAGVPAGIAKFDLTLSVSEPPAGGLVLEAEYARDLFDASTVGRLLGQLELLLGAAVADPGRRLSELPLLTPAQRAQLVVEWNATRAIEVERPLHALVAEQAARTPDAVAVSFGAEQLSYGELARRAGGLARRLCALGGGPEVRVGLCAERSLELVVGLLGVLTAGSAYVPLDPEYPDARLATLLEDSGASLLLVQAPLRERLRRLAGERSRLVALEAVLAETDWQADAAPPVADAGLDDLEQAAYVIFTSGSTGRPKGVVNSHRAVVNRLLDMEPGYGLTREDRVLQKAPFSFDVSVCELFGPLLIGAHLVVARPGGHQDGGYLVRTIARERVTYVEFVPSMLRVFLEEPELASCAGLRRVIAGGEALPADLVRRFDERMGGLGGVDLYNAYGPTEAAVDATYRVCRPGQDRAPIGRPVSGTRIHLLDGSGRLVPVAVPGELSIGGVQVARGYLGRPALTAERFVPDPFGEPGARLYKTGDLARHLPDGEVEYLGRVDHQVKIRGFRIELGEIEAALARHPSVHEAVVDAREAPGGPRLVAYWVPEPGAGATPESLREHLRQRLPEYMAPSAWVSLASLPKLPNGKVVRSALPEPPAPERTASGEPGSPVEEIVAGIWARVLELETVGSDESFFELGGHSLLATRVASRLREALGVDLPLRTLFEAPTVRTLAAAVERARATAAGSALPPLVAEPHGALVPTSPAQERMWFLERFEPGSVYNLPAAVRLEGEPEVAALAAVLAEIVRRHEALRTTFVEGPEVALQRVGPAPAARLPVVDLTGLSAAGRAAAGERLAAEEARRPFDLEAGPLLRAVLLRSAPGDHTLLLSMHHIVSDGWSMGVFARELGALYGAFREGRSSPLPELALQYADYALWQRRWLDGEEPAAGLRYWSEALAELATLELPTDRPRPPAQSFRGGLLRRRLPPELAERAVERARGEGATLFMVLLAAFAGLLARLAGQDDVPIGTPVANRDRVEVEELIGLFVNTLVLRTDASGDPSFSGLLGRVRERCLAGYGHQEVPFERLVEALQPERDPSRTPLFQVMLALQDAASEVIELPGLATEAVGVPAGSSKFDLFVSASEPPAGGLVLEAEYARDLFDASTVERLLGHLQLLLGAAVADPGRRLSELPLLTPAQRAQLVVEWNATWAIEVERPLHALVAEQAARTPDAVAVAFEAEQLSYAELARRAGALARRLRALGGGPEVRVGLCAERSLELVVGLLGVLTAGGAYVPLDPEYPDARLATLLEDSGASLLLVQTPLRERLRRLAGERSRLVALEAAPEETGWEADAAPPVADAWLGDLEQAAYVIFTSGSTGRPKGAVNSHRAVVNRLLWVQRLCGLAPEERVLQKTPFSFDVSVGELFWPLLAGACLVVARPGGHRDGRYLARTIARERVTQVHFVPSMLRVFLEEPDLEQYAGLRRVFASGEALSAELAGELLRRLGGPGGVELHNLYGPTEAAVEVTHHACRPREEHIPIGRPGDGTRIHLADSMGAQVPVGVAGELSIGGVQVARGYLGKPALTAERFVPDPFGEPGARLYRTGDLARHLPDGEIEYLGRIDHQVKVRGVRIELGEIEAVLASHPAVAGCAVAVRGEGARRGLVAYWVGELGTSATPAALREHLRERLPEPMVPTAWMELDRLPSTPSGKLDRKALPEPPAPEGSGGSEPRTPIEEIVAGVWARVLGLETVGAEASFFELGGHSLLATRVASRLREALGVDLPLRTLFEAPTVRTLAAAVERARATAAGSVLPPRVAEPHGALVPTSPAQERMWFLERFEPGSVYNLPAAVRLEGEPAVAALAAALAEIVRRHEALRTTFVEGPEVALQRVGPAPAARLPVVDLTGLSAAGRAAAGERLAAEEARRPFNLEAGPLLRAVLLRSAPGDHTLLLSMHHIVSDGWSMGVFARELGALYGAFREGRSSPLPELALQYADYALWQRCWLDGEEPAAGLRYWSEALAELATLELPTDRPRPPAQSFRGGLLRRRLPPELAERAVERARGEGATLFMVLLAAFAGLLARLAGQDDVPIGTPVANRDRVKVEDLIGLFVNTLVLRTDASGDPSFSGLLGRVRERCLAGYGHQEVPFERLVEALQPERDPSRTPLFQVMLALQDAASEAIELPGLATEAVGVPAASSKFDLFVSASEPPAGGLVLEAEYARDLFDASTVERLLGHLELLLGAAVADPGRRLSELPLLTPAQRAQLVVEWNATRAIEVERPLHALVAEQAARTPDAVAVAFEAEQLSYAELARRAGALARRLRALGVGPEVRVGLCAERSLELIVGLLGILEAGGAYVPLDPGYPDARLAILLEDAGAAALLVQTPLRERLQRLAGEEARLVEIEAAAVEEGGAGPPVADAGLGDLDDLAGLAGLDQAAYAIFTSGSTGRPKGAVNSHRAIVHRLLWMQRAYGLTPDDRVLQKTPFSFDVSVWELFWPLLTGARLVMARPEGHKDGRYLVRTIAGRRITHVHFVPSMLRAFLEESEVECCAGLRRVIASGEALPAELARRFHERLGAPGVELHNLYGPTEAAVDVTYHACRPGEERIPIGRPVDGTRIHLVDSMGAQAPMGVAGELSIGGAQVARGYLGKPALTAERFVPDPFGESGARLYRTGDLARHLPDGEIEYLGRIDHQVKVRGVRIELGEIEAVLASHPAVAGCAVAVRGEGARRGLVAYWVGEPGTSATPAALREHLRERLPEPMVPTAWMELDRLPSTPSGKLDRKALPEPPAPEGSGGSEPRTPIEEIVAGVWARVLGLETVGAEASFFELGGHSLLATRVASRLREALGVDLPLRTLFEAPTVRTLAAAVERARATARDPISVVPRGGELPVSAAQERLWFLAQLSPESPAYNIPAGLRLRGDLDTAALAGALCAVRARHESLRTTFGESERGPFQRVAPAVGSTLPLVDLTGLAAAGSEALRLARFDAERPFDLARGPLFRFVLARIARADHLLLLDLHHTIADGWSLEVLTREVGELYGALRTGREPELPPLPVQYPDYAAWQRRWLEGEELVARLARVRERLSGAPLHYELPGDRPRPAVQSQAGGLARLPLDPLLVAGLRGLGRRSMATTFMTLLAGFAALLARHAGNTDLLVGTPVANRDRVEVEGLIGLFVNTLVVRCDLAGNPGVAELVRRVREAALDSYAEQDVPFERLVAEVSRERNLGQNPLVQVMFNLLAPPRQTGLPGIEVETVEVPARTAKLDLTLTALDHGEDLALTLEYSTDLFDPTTARRWLERYRTVLTGMVECEEDHRLADLPLLPAPERAQLLREWNDTSRPIPHATVHELFLAQAARTPCARAVSCDGGFLTYAALEREVHALASHLRRLGLGRGQLVALCLERSVGMAVAVLGVLEAGGAYVPLDPSYPRERLAMMLEDADPSVLLTEARLAPALPPHGARRVLLDDPVERERIAAGAEAPPEPVAGPDDLAYVLFTSGSTGRPKGVQVPHAAVVNVLSYLAGLLPFSEGDRWLAVSSLSFDIAGVELFLPLCVGAEVEIAPRAVARDGLRLRERVEEGGIAALQATPATWKLLLEAGWQGGEELVVLSGGEAMSRDLATELLARTPRVWNLYGPTEATIYSTGHALAPGAQGPVPIGRPVANTRARLLGRVLEPIPTGATGELCLGGTGLSWGYRGRPGLTAERFVPDAAGDEPGARLYRTGDLARSLPDGSLDFLGRADHQVKVRGHRIELGEIESALGRHPEVAACAAALRPGPGGEPRLVAYVVARAGEPAEPDELRRFLRDRLPEPMLPASYVALLALPLTPNGKLDRKALPEPTVRPRPAAAAPRSEAERRIAEIWRDLLGVEPRLHDNFFDLGGHSLLLLRAHRRLQAAFDREVPLTEMFRHPTVASLGELLAHGGRRERSLEKSFARAARKRGARTRRHDVVRRGSR